VLAEEARPGTFAGLCLYEPVIFPAPPSAPSIAGNRLAEGALRRRETFPSRAAALAHFSTRPPLCALDPDVLTAYVEQGFRDLPDGSVGLACERRHEALVYAHGLSHHGFADLEKVRCRVVVTYGEHTDSFGPSLLRPTVERLPNACLHELSGLGHFGPLENPTVVADSILATFTPSAPSTRPGSNTAAP
jgi:pimeloyl-ACP methyl ester carboxylesterase